MRYFRLEHTDPETGDRVSNIHAIDGDVSGFLEHAKKNADKVVELEEKEVEDMEPTC